MVSSIARGILVLVATAVFAGCASSGSVAGNDKGSSPINKEEKLQYEKAVIRCYKTGGTRVVKIMGTLRCY